MLLAAALSIYKQKIMFVYHIITERPLIPGVYLIIVDNYKTVIIPNGSSDPLHPIVVAQAKLQPKDQT